jgi:cytochrome c-type biogenesis protein CcmE
MNVIYSGPPPSNMGEATQVVAVGGMKDGVFRAHQLNLKCPSKYEGKKKS